jgi:hypothetical protein
LNCGENHAKSTKKPQLTDQITQPITVCHRKKQNTSGKPAKTPKHLENRQTRKKNQSQRTNRNNQSEHDTSYIGKVTILKKIISPFSKISTLNFGSNLGVISRIIQYFTGKFKYARIL